jgi:hypothetical protein
MSGHQTGHQPLLHAGLELVLRQLHLPLLLGLHDGIGPVGEAQLTTGQLTKALVVLVLKDVTRMMVSHVSYIKFVIFS